MQEIPALLNRMYPWWIPNICVDLWLGNTNLESVWLCIYLTRPAAAENHSYLGSFHKSITSSEQFQERDRAVFCPIRRLLQHQLADVTEPETTQCSSELARTLLHFPVLWYPSNKMWGSNWRYFFPSVISSLLPSLSPFVINCLESRFLHCCVDRNPWAKAKSSILTYLKYIIGHAKADNFPLHKLVKYKPLKPIYKGQNMHASLMCTDSIILAM